MKVALLVLNFILLVAVGYLYYEHYHYITEDIHGKIEDEAAVKNSFKIAYFELDSLQNNYTYYKEVISYLTKKDNDNNQQLNKIKNNYLNTLKEYQQKGNLMTQTEQSQYEQKLAKLQDDYQQTMNNLSDEMNAESAEKLTQVKMKIQDFLKTYCPSKGYAYVFASSDKDFVYYKDTVRNITNEVIKGLNEAYEKEKKK